ncbi:hypothetical protein [Paracoccus homiensis]|uniref:hypothetical protein n=1 Tax=Paracoccus homiensis TaxID=364199 RepID=UPI00398CFDF2
MARLESIPLDQLDANWRLAQTKMWPFSVFAKSSVRKLLQTYAEGGKADPHSDIAALADAKRTRAEIEATPLAGCPVVKGVETDPARLSDWMDQPRAMKTALAEVAPAVADPVRWDLARQSLDQRNGGDLRNAITLFQRKHESWQEHAGAFAQTAHTLPEGTALSELLASLQAIQNNKEHLQDWTRWVEVRTQAMAQGLRP